MTKAAEMAKTTARGSFHLFWGLVASTLISAAGTIYLANLLSPDEMGLYALAIAAPNLIGVFRDWGVNSAIIRYTAQFNTEEQLANIRKILQKSLVFEVFTGLTLTAISFLFSKNFADIYQIAIITPLIQVASFTILINAFLTTAQSAFIGLEQMELNSISLTVQSIIKALIVPLLVVVGLGVFGAVLGFTFAFLIAGITATLLLWKLYKKLPNSTTKSKSQTQTKDSKQGTTPNIKTLLKYGLPLSISSIITTFQTQFYTILMGIYVSTELIGNYSLAITFVVLITFLATPVTTVLFPAFSKLDPYKDHEALKSVYQFSIKYAALLVVPMAAMVMAMSGPAIFTLFGNKYPSAPIFLTLLAITYTYTAFGSLSTTNLINSQGKTSYNLKLTMLAAAIGFPLSIIMASQIGVIGIILTSLIAGLPSLLLSLQWIKKSYGLTIDWGSSLKILFSSAFAGVTAYALQSQIAFSSWVQLLIGALTFAMVLIPAILATKTIGKADIENLRIISTSLGPLNRILIPALNILEKLISIIDKPERKPQTNLVAKKIIAQIPLEKKD